MHKKIKSLYDLKAPYDHIIISAEKLVEDTLKFGDKEIFFDGSFNHLENSRIYGRVLAVPERLSDQFIGLTPEAKPISIVEPRQFRKMRDIEMNIEVGDIVYFHYTVLSEDGEKLIVGEYAGEPVFKVRYDRIWARRNKELTEGVGSNVLVEPIMESWEDMTIKTFTDLKDRNGDPVPKHPNQWLVTKIAPENKKLEGIVRHSGPNYKGYDRIEEGRKVLFNKNADFKLTMDKDIFYVMRSHNVFCYLDD